ncbi:MAG TPA: hypothetical protein VGC77_13850 [Rhodopseudomonas sp.]|uniref:hypothetical protein n=1 Tax=Rhodopseudomonas sp. TaxID=1078 RepID=UPI002EDB0F77
MSQKLARAFVSDAISNSHAAIKACWLIVFSAGTFAALSTLNTVLIQMDWLNGVVSPQNRITEHPLICFILFVVFVLTFLRFYIGDVRIFDIRYTEIFKLVNLSIDLSDDPNDFSKFKKLVLNSDRNLYKFEVVILTFQTLIIVFLAFQISNWLNFARVYSFLMVWNVVYLIFNYFRSRAVVSPVFLELFPNASNLPTIAAMFPMQASLIWIVNNFIAAVVLSPSIFYSSTGSAPSAFAAVVCICVLGNCLIDFFLARDFYFPRFTEFLNIMVPDIMVSEPSSIPLGKQHPHPAAAPSSAIPSKASLWMRPRP